MTEKREQRGRSSQSICSNKNHQSARMSGSAQLAVEYILARILFHLKERGEHDLVEQVLVPPEGAAEQLAYTNVIRRIAFLIRR